MMFGWRRILATTLVVAAAMSGTVSCGQSTTGQVQTRAAEQSAEAATGRSGQSTADQEFLDTGPDVARAREANPGLADPGFQPMLTVPLDVSGPGEYRMIAGPIPTTAIDLNQALVSLPASFMDHAVATPTIPPAIVVIDGDRYLEVTLSVTSIDKPYTALQAWVY
jgi:hypothetical protein